MLALGSGLIGGIFFAFSSFIMKALARVPPAHGIAVMQSINVTVLNIWFSRCSLGLERAASCLASVRSFAGRNQAQVICSPAVCFYLVGTMIVTVACNVPLNDALTAVDPSSADAGRV